MSTSLNSAASLKLQPNNSNAIGRIVEEHIRYYQGRKEAKEAQLRASAIRQAEFQRKLNKDAFEAYKGIAPDENEGFLNAQIVAAYNKNKPKLAQLAKAASRGDMNAMLQLEDEKRRLASISKVNKIYGEKFAELRKQKSEGTFNEILDSDLERVMDSFSTGKFVVNDDYSIDAYIPSKDQVVRLSPSQLQNNEILSGSFTRKANFVENGNTIAQSLLDKNDGNKLIEKDTKSNGIRLIRSLFDQDDIEARTWYGTFIKKQGVDPSVQKPYSELTELEKNTVAESYYNENVLPQIQEVIVDDTLDDQNKRLTIANKSLDAEKKRRALEEDDKKNRSNISLSTDEDGKTLQLPFPSTKFPSGADLFNIADSGVVLRGVKGDKDTETTVTHIYLDKGRVNALGNRIKKVPIKDEFDDATGKFRDEVEQVAITEREVLNRLSTLIKDEEGNKLKNLKELRELLLRTKKVNAPFSSKGTTTKKKKFDPKNF